MLVVVMMVVVMVVAMLVLVVEVKFLYGLIAPINIMLVRIQPTRPHTTPPVVTLFLRY